MVEAGPGEGSRWRRFAAAAAAIVALGASGAARGDPGFDANRYMAPPLAADGLTLERPTTLKAGTWGVAAAISHADDALRGKLAGGGERQIIEEQLWLYGFVAYGLLDRLTLHATLPVPIRQVGDTRGVEGITTRLHDFAVGDLKLGGRVGIVGPPRDLLPLGLALDASLLLPVGSREAFASDGKVRVRLAAIAEAWLPPALFAGVTAGVLTRPELREAGSITGTMAQVGAAFGWRTSRDAVRLGVEANTQIPFAHSGSSYEILGVAKVGILRRLHAAIGAGPGVGAGKQTPDFRAVARVGWQAEPRSF
ncbi:MAG TPA: hypothetical protein VN033_03515 [Vulgatibacter sp.]|nr:hypothetical protein [Vulgatibacter sp.]